MPWSWNRVSHMMISVLFPNNFFLSSSSKQQETSNGEDIIQMHLPSSGQKECSDLQSFSIQLGCCFCYSFLALIILENVTHSCKEFNQQYLSYVAQHPFICSIVSHWAIFIDISPSTLAANQILTLQKHDITTAWPWHLFDGFAWLMLIFSRWRQQPMKSTNISHTISDSLHFLIAYLKEVIGNCMA